MDKSPNWCPICKRETEWLIVPFKPSFVQCEECGHLKKFPHLKGERHKLEEPSVKEKSAIQSPERIVDFGLAIRVVLRSMAGGFLVGMLFLILGCVFISQGSFILATIFFILFAITVQTIGIYFILCEAEEIAERKLEKEIE